MIGIILTSLGVFFSEIANSIGKWEVSHKKETIYVMGFLHLFWATLFFAILILIRGDFLFSLASLPTFIPRAVLEIFQMQMGIIASAKAERSALGFITTGTIPLLILADIILGYSISIQQFTGLILIISSILFLFINHGLNKKGLFYVLFVTINGAITISLYKYNITHFNSVEAEQGLIYIILMVYFTFATIFINKINPFKFIFKYPFSIQSLASGGASMLLSFAYLFAPASIITTTKRAVAILASVLSGKFYFHEKNMPAKIMALIIMVAGLLMLYI